MSVATLDFEKPALEIEAKIAELKSLSNAEKGLKKDLPALETKAAKLLDQAYARLDPWQKTQVARHPERPHTLDYIAGMVTDFTPLAGDRLYAEDAAMISGLGRIDGRAVAILGQEKGADMDGRLRHNFGMARPEAIYPYGNGLSLSAAICSTVFTPTSARQFKWGNATDERQ